MGTEKNSYLQTTIHQTNEISIKEIIKLLQFYPEIFKTQGGKQTGFEDEIGGRTKKFRLSKAPRGVNQVLVHTFKN